MLVAVLFCIVGLSYAVTPPAKIVAYLPVTFFNYQPTAIGANVPLAVGEANTVAMGMIGFPANSYQQYEVPNMSNVEFFFSNGTIINSWLEGNYLNEMSANGVAASFASSNALADSANVLWWVEYPWPSSFLPAGSSAAPAMNTIYMGFAANAVSSADNLFNGKTVGEAPQLDCANPYNTITCAYAAFDNGNTVFGDAGQGLYSNWAGNAISTTTSTTDANWTYQINAGTAFTGESLYSDNGLYIISSSTGGSGLSTLKSAWGGENAISTEWLTEVGAFGGSAPEEDGYICSTFSVSAQCGGTVYRATYSTALDGQGDVNWKIDTPTATYASAVYPYNSMYHVFQLAYNYSGGLQNNNYRIQADYNMSNPPLVTEGSTQVTQGYVYIQNFKTNFNVTWARIRVMPTNGILPGTAFGAVTPVTGCSALISNPSNTYADAGQYETFTASESGCTSPYTYNILVVNSITVGTITHNSLDSGDSATSNTFTFPTASADTSNSPEKANVILTSGSGTTASAYSGTFTVSPAMSGLALTSSPSLPSTQETGNTITLTASFAGGTSGYTYNFIGVNTVTGAVVANYLVSNSYTSNAFAWTIPGATAGNEIEFNVLVTDSASTPESINSVKSAALTIVSGPPSVSSFTPSAPASLFASTYTYPSNILFSAAVSGGSPPYTYNFLVVNAVTGAVVANYLTTNTYPSNDFLFNAESVPDSANSPLEANVIVTGGGTGASAYTSGFNVYPNMVTFNTFSGNPTIAFGTNTMKDPSNPMLYNGIYYEFLTETPSGGSPYHIEMATSTNLITWTDGGSLTLDGGSDVAPSLVYNAQTSEWVMYFTHGPVGNAIYDYYTSNIADAASWQSGQTFTAPTTYGYDPSVIHTPSGYEMFYACGSTLGQTALCNATSANAIGPWTAYSGNPVGTNPNGQGVEAPAIFTYNNTYDVVFSIPQTTEQVWMFSSNKLIGGAWTFDPHAVMTSAGQSWVTSTDGVGSPEIYIPNTPGGDGIGATSNQIDMLYQGSIATSGSPQWQVGLGYFPNLPTTCSASITNPSNAVADVGQYETFTASESGCTSTFTYNTLISNSITTGTIAHNDLVTGSSASSVTYTFPTVSADTSNSPEQANVIVTDSASHTVASAYSSTFQVNPAFLSTSWTASNSQIDEGQYQTLTADITGGSSSYTYNFLVYNSYGLVDNALYSSVSSTSNSFTFPENSAWGTGTLTANVAITDSASTPETVTNTLTYTANAALGVPALTSTPALPVSWTSGNTITFTASWSGGTADYSANYIIANTITKTIIASQLYTGIAATTNSFAWLIPSADNGNTVYANVIITDSASTPETANSINSNTLTITSYSPPSITLSSCPDASHLDAGQIVTCTATVAGGTSPYTYNWLVSNSITGAITANFLYSGLGTSNTLAYLTTTADTYNSPLQFNVIVTDAKPTTVNSVYSSPFTVNAALSISLTPASATITSGQSIAINALAAGGTLPISYQWYSNAGCSSAIGGATANSYLASPTSTTTYCIKATDSANTAETASATSIITVGNQSLDFPLWEQNWTSTNTLPPSFPACTSSTSGGECVGNILVAGNRMLTGDLFVIGNVNITSSGTLWSNGWSIIVTGTFINHGLLDANTIDNGGIGAAGGSINTSYGGSGGGGGGDSATGGAGGNTLALGGSGGNTQGGNGASPAMPVISTANILGWYANWTAYLGGAGGGGGLVAAGGNGGGGSYGLYLQASNLTGGDIVANGLAGLNCNNCAAGGGGGGGLVILAYGTSYTSGTYNTMGGGAGECIGCASPGGSGGDGNVMIYHYSSPPLALPLKLDYYPFKLFTRSNASDVNFTLEQQYDGGTPAVLQSNMLNISYVPPETQAAGFYNFTLIERSPGAQNTLYSNLHVNMTDMNGELTTGTSANSMCEYNWQYFPNCAVFPFASNAFTAIPTGWKISSDVAVNTHSNFTGAQYAIEQFSNANLTFSPSIMLTYNQFAPAISFALNSLNNPSVQRTLTQNAFKWTLAASAPAQSRETNNISIYDERTQKLLTANLSSISADYLFNNYSFSNVSSAAQTNSIRLYMPLSNYQNPVIYQGSLGILGGAGSAYLPAVNNYCGSDIQNGNYRNNQIYLVGQYPVGQSYSFSVYRGYDPLPAGTYVEVYAGISNSLSVGVQSYLISSSLGFSVPLVIGNPYSFLFFNCTSTIYRTNSSIWTSPITLYLPQNISTPSYNVPVLNASCITLPYEGNEMINCTGSDTAAYTNAWEIYVYNVTNILQQQLIANTIIHSATFRYSYFPAYGSTKYHVVGIADVGNVVDPQYTALSYYTTGILSVAPAILANGWLAILMILGAIAIGSRTYPLAMLYLVVFFFMMNIFTILPLLTAIVYLMIAVAALVIFLGVRRMIY